MTLLQTAEGSQKLEFVDVSSAMDPGHLNELIDLEESYWWHVAKRQLVTMILERQFPPPGRLVEGGVGSSRNLVEFQQLGYEVRGLDILPAAVEHARSRGLNGVVHHDLSQPWPLDRASTQVVVLLDVLEHMQDPVQVLRHAAATLAPGGGIILTVPAYRWLYSQWDKTLGHFRRYVSVELRGQAEAASLKVTWLSYWNAFSLPAAVAVRSLQRYAPQGNGAEFPRVSPTVNRVLLALAWLERRYLQKFSSPMGLSLVGVLRK